MNPAEECLNCLQQQNWTRLSSILSDNSIAGVLAESPTFSIFENIFIDELKKFEKDSNQDFLIVAVRIFQIHQNKNSAFNLSHNALLKIAKYLFDKNPQENYAKIFHDDSEAQQFLENYNHEIQSKIETTRISANLNIKVGEHAEIVFQKEIFNSPQEIELFIAAKKVLPISILLPNIALSTIIDSKVCEFLDKSTTTFFFKSTIDLCIVNPYTFTPDFSLNLTAVGMINLETKRMIRKKMRFLKWQG